jgi:hypothetical protein
MIGPPAFRWLGAHLAHTYKYTYAGADNAWEPGSDYWDKEDRHLANEDFPIIALDLDTTPLGPLIAYISLHAQREAHGRRFFGMF